MQETLQKKSLEMILKSENKILKAYELSEENLT